MTIPEASCGNALARRDLLLVSGVGMALAATPSCAQSLPPSRSEPGYRDGASAHAFGAIGDGQYHALSTRFATLAQAQATYPFVTRLDQSIDWAGIQAAINSVEGAGGSALIPVGRFLITDSLALPSAVTLRGESRNGSVIDNQNLRLNAPQIVNKDPVAFLYATIRDLTLNGGTHAIKVRATREVAGIVIDGITTNLQSEANIMFSSMQTTVIRDCHLMDGKHGVSVEGFPCNSVHLINTRLGRHSDASVRMRGADGFVMFGGSIEAGGVAGRATIDVETGGAYANAIHFQNVYFENTHEFLLRSRGARTIGFHDCKITGTGAQGKGMAGYRFDCQDDMVVFADNFWGGLPTAGPANMLLQGVNEGLGGRGNLWRERSGRSAALTSRHFSAEEARRGMCVIDFGHGEGRAYGSLQICLDAGADQAIRRLYFPLDFVVDGSGPAKVLGQPTGDVQLSTTVVDQQVQIGLRGPALSGYRHLWFELDLHADTNSTMAVKAF